MTLSTPRNSQDRAAAYARAAGELAGYPVDQILALAKDAEGLLAAIASSEITGAPSALILVGEQPFLNDRSADPILTEAIERARITFSLSLPLCATLQSNLGKRLWFLPEWFTSTNGAASNQATALRNREILGWILDSLKEGVPPQNYLHGTDISTDLARTVPYVDPSAPAGIHWSMHAYFQALYRLSQSGYRPDFIVDVGASTGFWSHVASHIFPQSRFYLIEPLLEQYQRRDKAIYSMHPEFVTIAAAAGDQPGEAVLNVSTDLYSSSLLDGPEGSPDLHWEKARVPIRTLDEISSTFAIAGQGALKIDVQMAEHLVLDGAIRFLEQIDVICIELSLNRFAPSSKNLFEMMTKLHELGFQYFDTAGSWRHSRSGRMIQQDTIFMRAALAENLAWE
ncbi:MAG: FkbM family methyltransferase [Verrucomicrobia bacterium]|nr:FkbM family methyltransferase [Verrucomicrobiota bacterium]